MIAWLVPPARPKRWGVTAVVTVKQDMRHHPVGPLAAQECLNLDDRTRFVEPRQAECDQTRIPVPLRRIEASRGRHGVRASIVTPKNFNRLLLQFQASR